MGEEAFRILIKPNGSVCNLNCAYCFFLTKERLYPGGLFLMSDETLKASLRQAFQAASGRRLVFAWGGGEPAMIGLDFFRRALDYQERFSGGSLFANEFQTNATMLDNAWCEFFHNESFQVAISVDGPRELHDIYRHDKEDLPTFERVMSGFQLLLDHNVSPRILCSVHSANVRYPLEVYRFFRDELGASSIQFIPIVERDNNTGFQEGNTVTPRSVDPRAYGDFLVAIFDEWLKYDTEKVAVSTFQAALANWVGLPPQECSFSNSCGGSPALEHNGDLYCCEHFVEPNYFLGNIKETPIARLAIGERQASFCRNKAAMLPRYCRECDVLFACHGECPKNRFAESPQGEPGLNYLCPAYKAFFSHVTWPVEVMARLLAV